VDMCKGKRKYDYEAPMTSSLSDCTWLEKEWQFRLSTTWHPSLHFIFLSPTWFTPLISFLPLLFSLFLLFFSFFQSLSFIPSYTHIFSFAFYFSFFLLHTHIFLFTFPSLDIFISLFEALNSSLYCISQSDF
jgi:hypothetical protein